MVEQVDMNSSHNNVSMWITEKREKPREDKFWSIFYNILIWDFHIQLHHNN